MNQEATDATLARMGAQVAQWSREDDARSDFLRCYSLMTGNMLEAVGEDRFHDPDWVARLLHRFAEYYFDALDAFESGSEGTPPVWQHAHVCTCSGDLSILRRLLLGINAHINYDLVLALVDMLDSEWEGLDETARRHRYQDHCTVNEVIGETIDAVQDGVVEPEAPLLDLVDKGLGPVDEWVTSRVIAAWRQDVWDNAVTMLTAGGPAEREAVRAAVEVRSLERARWLSGDH